MSQDSPLQVATRATEEKGLATTLAELRGKPVGGQSQITRDWLSEEPEPVHAFETELF